MSIEWFYLHAGEVVGPITAQQLRDHALAGRVSPDEYVKRGGEGDWLPAKNVKGLFAPPPPAPAPPPVAAASPPPPTPAPVTSAELVRPSANEDVVRCPKCGSTQLAADKKGFGLGKAIVGGVLTGGVGLLAGFIGSRKVLVTCLKCGNQWEAGSQ